MIIENVTAAFGAIFEIQTLALMILGVAAGLIAGAIPGFTITMAVVLTLPFTFGMPAVQGLATMIGVFVGGLSGGLMAGILTGIPGMSSADGRGRYSSLMGQLPYSRWVPCGRCSPSGSGSSCPKERFSPSSDGSPRHDH